MANIDCWYYDDSQVGCLKAQGSAWCDENCPIYKTVLSHFKKSNLPEKYWYPFTLHNVEVDKLEIKKLVSIRDNLSEFVNAGKNLLLQSDKCGNGKTSWGIKLLQRQIDIHHKGSSWSFPPAFFIYTPSLLLMGRDSISNKNSNFQMFKMYLENSDLVLFDDIGCINLKDYDLLVLSTIIEARILNGLSSIFTTNLKENSLKEVLGERLYDRIFRLSEVITFKAGSMRGK